MVTVLAIENEVPLDKGQLSLYLPQSVVDNAAKYKNWHDAQAHMLGRLLLLHGLRLLGYSKDILNGMRYTEYNRPYLSIPLDFSIAHSGKYVLCAISTSRVGVDVECIREVAINDFTDLFSNDELLKIQSSPVKYDEFFRHWTIKEAIAKADGRGINVLSGITVTSGSRVVVGENSWHIYNIDLGSGYQSHLAGNVAEKPVLSLINDVTALLQ